jgi:predicted AlkP superfamily pyrophosphatase or phosphodiesterase
MTNKYSYSKEVGVEAHMPFCFKTKPLTLQSLVLLLAIFALVANATAEPTPAKKSDRIVVMISLDGLAAHYFDDPKAEMPTIRALAAEGARATGMKASTPTVTWPNHTTLVTGVEPARHGVVGNNYLDRKTGKRVTLITDPVFDKDEIVKVPTIYDVAKAEGLKTAAIRWPASRNAKALDWTMPDVASVELLKQFSTPALLEACDKAGLNLFRDEASKTQIVAARQPGDGKYTQVFNMILQKNRPNLALLHLVNVDHTQHMKGPNSEDAYAAVKEADAQVRQVWEELHRDFPGRATLLIVSDHGFSPIKNTILPNVVLRKAGLLDSKENPDGPVKIVTQGGSAFLYISDNANRSSIANRIKIEFSHIKEVTKILLPKDFKKYGVADPRKDPHAPDMILFAQEGFAFGDTAAGDLPFEEKPERKGSHGHDPNLPDLHATFVAWGVGIKKGVRLGEISNISVAPTIAKLLDVNLPDTDGKPLTKALAD